MDEDPRITLFRIAALQEGYSPEEVDLVVQQIQAKQQTPEAQLDTLKTEKQLEELQLTPEEKGELSAREKAAEEKALQEAGIGLEEEDTEYATVMSFIDTLEEDYNKAGLGQKSGLAARGEGVSTFMDILMGKDDPASRFKDNKSGFVATLKSITGDTGVLTEQDAKRLLGLLPGLGSTKGEAEKFDSVRKQIAVKYGKQPLKLGQAEKVLSGETKPKTIDQKKAESARSRITSSRPPEGQTQLQVSGQDGDLFKEAQRLRAAGDNEGAQNLTRIAAAINQGEAEKMKLGPVATAGAEAQKVLGNSPILQILGGILGRGINPTPLGSGIGAAGGEYLQESLAQPSSNTLIKTPGGERRPNIEGILPTGDKLKKTVVTGATTAGTDFLLSKVLPGYLKPRSTATAKRTQEYSRATQAGQKLTPSDLSKRTAQQIIKKKEFLPEKVKPVLQKISKGQKLTPDELMEAAPRIREMGRTLTNNPLRSDQGMMFNQLYDDIVAQTKSELPGVYKQTVKIAKTFPKATKDLERGEKLARGLGKTAVDIGKLGATGYILGKLGLFGNRN